MGLPQKRAASGVRPSCCASARSHQQICSSRFASSNRNNRKHPQPKPFPTETIPDPPFHKLSQLRFVDMSKGTFLSLSYPAMVFLLPPRLLPPSLLSLRPQITAHRPICSLKPPSTRPNSANPPHLIPLSAYITYITALFVVPPTPPTSDSLAEALKLSLNFLYLIPLSLPTFSPLHPLLESLFHIIVAWAVLLFAFAAEDIRDDPAIPIAPFLIGAAFLTNIVYLPYLIFRKAPRSKLTNVPKEKNTLLIQFSESLTLPIFTLSLLPMSILWAILARPEFGEWSVRSHSFVQLLHTDILAYSFAVDALVFALFQAYLVPDDAERRIWHNLSWKKHAVRASRIPFLGLVAYLFIRNRHAPIQWTQPHP